MNYELTTLFGLGSGYLLLLFAIAGATDSGWIPQRLARNPLVFVLSLGVFASVWAYYTSIGYAQRDGYGYMAPSIGVALAFLFSPLILKPLLVLTRIYQLGSLADLMAFRYRSPWAGTLSTLVILVGVTPLVALQIRAVSDTTSLLSASESRATVAFGFCLLITLFTILFGTSRHTGRSRHDGLIMAIAFSSLFKLVVFLAVGLFAVYGAFGNFAGLDSWLQGQPELLLGRKSEYFASFHIMALLFFTAALAMPHMFYVTMHEHSNQAALSLASWGLPLYFLLLSWPVLPILWAGLQAGSSAQADYFPVVIGTAYDVPLLSLLAYLGGLSAASGLIILITLPLSGMCLNHLLLPLYQPSRQQDIYRWLLWHRRLLIMVLIWSGFGFHYLLDASTRIETISSVAFIACLQFLPGIVAILYWPQGNKKGFISGLLAGVCIGFALLSLPLLGDGAPWFPWSINWRAIAALSLTVNSLCFVFVSLRTTSTDEELEAAEVCALDTIRRHRRSGLVARSPNEFIRSLSKPLGENTARREVMRALQELHIDLQDRRPASLRSLRDRMEANLSGLLGPAIAQALIDNYLPYSIVSGQGTTDFNVFENRIKAYRSNLSGLAADLDKLQRHYRQVLLDLPMGVCSLGSDLEIIMWNRNLELFTGIAADTIVGSCLHDIEEPWLSLVRNFLNADSPHTHKYKFQLNHQQKTVNLHKTYIDRHEQQDSSHERVIILIEDITETELLEVSLTHNQRLASIGRLAAGVAHEIGNPITGIACLAQTIRDEYAGDKLRKLAEQIIEQTDRTSKILHSLVNFAHGGNNAPPLLKAEAVNVAECMDKALTLISLDKNSKQVNIKLRCYQKLEITGDSQKLLQVLVNLINNSRDASQPGGTVLLQTFRIGKCVSILVTDQGTGIPEAIQDRIFEPFFTTKDAGEGTGLGLSLVYSLLKDLNGSIAIISPLDKIRGIGTTVVLRFPLRQEESEADIQHPATSGMDGLAPGLPEKTLHKSL